MEAERLCFFAYLIPTVSSSLPAIKTLPSRSLLLRFLMSDDVSFAASCSNEQTKMTGKPTNKLFAASPQSLLDLNKPREEVWEGECKARGETWGGEGKWSDWKITFLLPFLSTPSIARARVQSPSALEKRLWRRQQSDAYTFHNIIAWARMGSGAKAVDSWPWVRRE